MMMRLLFPASALCLITTPASAVVDRVDIAGMAEIWNPGLRRSPPPANPGRFKVIFGTDRAGNLSRTRSGRSLTKSSPAHPSPGCMPLEFLMIRGLFAE
jgi:hypothetical protein